LVFPFTYLYFCIHIRTVCDKQFDDFLLTAMSRKMQRRSANLTLRIQIRTIGDYRLFNSYPAS